jgi:tetratricopeptide (TPR) repeat protein
MTCFAEINMGDAALSSNDRAVAAELLKGVEAVALSSRTHSWMKWRYTTHVLLSRGRLELTLGNVSAARDYAEQCLKHAKPTDQQKYIAGAWTLLGDCARADLDWEKAEKWYRQANAAVCSIGHKPQIWQSHGTLAALYRETDRPDLARQHYGAAVAAIERLRQSTLDPRLRTGMDGSARMNEIIERARSINPA